MSHLAKRINSDVYRRVLARRVQRGIKFLNEREGNEEWKERIDLKTLDLSDWTMCVVGQLYGDFTDNPTSTTAEEDGKYGFGVGRLGHPSPEDKNYYGRVYDVLTEEWKKALAE